MSALGMLIGGAPAISQALSIGNKVVGKNLQLGDKVKEGANRVGEKLSAAGEMATKIGEGTQFSQIGGQMSQVGDALQTI